jgi:hypothetical protein
LEGIKITGAGKRSSKDLKVIRDFKIRSFIFNFRDYNVDELNVSFTLLKIFKENKILYDISHHYTIITLNIENYKHLPLQKYSINNGGAEGIATVEV